MDQSQLTSCTRGTVLSWPASQLYTLVFSSMIIIHSAVRWSISRNSLLTSRNTTRMVLLITPLKGSSTHHYLGKLYLKHLMIWDSFETVQWSLFFLKTFCRACVLYSDNNNPAVAQQSSTEVTDGLSKCSIRDTERPRGADRNAQMPMSRVPINVPQTIQGLALSLTVYDVTYDTELVCFLNIFHLVMKQVQR